MHIDFVMCNKTIQIRRKMIEKMEKKKTIFGHFLNFDNVMNDIQTLVQSIKTSHIWTSRDRPMSAPYLRLNNSKSSSKRRSIRFYSTRNFFWKSLTMPKITGRGHFGLVRYCTLRGKPFWFSSLGQRVQFGTMVHLVVKFGTFWYQVVQFGGFLKFCRTLGVL